MSYLMKYSLGCVEDPTIRTIPTYVGLLLDTFVDSVSIINNGESDEEFDRIAEELLVQYIANSEYQWLENYGASKDEGSCTLYLPGVANSAITIKRGKDKVEIHRAVLEEFEI